MPVTKRAAAPAAALDDKPNRFERRRQRTRAAILDAADRVFHRRGVDNATVNEIADEADIAYATFYLHFGSMDEVIGARAHLSVQRVADYTDLMLKHAGQVELLPCIGARVVMRILSQDPAIHWMIERPIIFANSIYEAAAPFMRSEEQEAVADGRLKPAGGHETWIRTYPWILLAELREALQADDITVHEERFAILSLRLLGVDDARAPALIERSRVLVKEFGLEEPKRQVRKKSRKVAKSKDLSAA